MRKKKFKPCEWLLNLRNGWKWDKWKFEIGKLVLILDLRSSVQIRVLL